MSLNDTLFSPWKNFKYDIPASIVVFLVAAPLCLGIALASGAPLFAGIIAGFVGGIVVGTFSGSPLGVSGPAAGLAVIVFDAIKDLGGFPIFLVAVVLGGAIQLILGFLRAGVIGYYFPNSVIKGMLSGIGIFIFLKQIPHAFGYDKVSEGDWEFIQQDGHNTFSELYYMLESVTPGAIIISAVSLAILILWEQPFMKRIKLFQLIQGPLIAVLVGIGLGVLFEGYEGLRLAREHFVDLPVSDSVQGFWAQFQTPDWSALGNGKVYFTAGVIALVASLETLLCVEATDKLDPYKRITPTNRELKAQGLGNMVSGLLGGLPVTQVIVRSSANIQSGGRTKTSAITHGFLLLFCVFLIPNLLNLIPYASLAAILIVVGYKLAKPSLFKQMYKLGWSQFIPYMVTVVFIIVIDLLWGVGLGLAVAIIIILYNSYKTPYFFHAEERKPGDPYVLKLAEYVTFIHKSSIMQTLNNIPEESVVVIDASRTVRIDQDVKDIFSDFEEQAKLKKITIEAIDLDDQKIGNQLKGLYSAVKEE